MRVLLSVLACCTLLACGGAQSRLASHMRKGQEYFVQENFQKANIEFRNALQIAPHDAAALVMAGRTAEKLTRVREAIGFYQAAVESAPDNIEARASLARIYVVVGAPELALKLLEPGLAKHPDSVPFLTYRAAARARLKDTSGAIADAERALQLDPASQDAVALRASFYRNAGDFVGAETLLNNALLKAPDSPDLREILAQLYGEAQEPEKAEAQLHILVKLKPQELRYRVQLADFYTAAKRLDEAQRVLQEAVLALPHNDAVKLRLVDFLAAHRTAAQAEQVLGDFVAHAPKDYELQLGLGALQERMGQTQGALSTYQKVMREDASGAQGLTARERVMALYAAQGRDAEARAMISEILKKNPRDIAALLARSEQALKSGDPAAAIADLRAVVRDQPGNAMYQQLLAQAYRANGELTLALETLRSAKELAPADAALQLQLAQLLLEMKQPDAAVAILEQTAHDVPANALVREALARAYIAKGDFAAARNAAADVKTLAPKSASGFYLAGIAAQGANHPDEARHELEQALAIQPTAFDALTALARLEASNGHAEKAIGRVQEAAAKNPHNAFPLNLLGELYMAVKKPALSIEAFRQAISVAPRWYAPYRNLAVVQQLNGDTAGAIASYQAGIQALPTDPKLITELALLLEKQGRVDEAIAAYEAWNRQNPHVSLIANNLALLLVNHKQDHASLDRARELTSGFASSDDGMLLDTLGWVHFKRAEYLEALPQLERAAERSPDSKEIHYHLGMAELQAGRTDRARQELETALAGNPAFDGNEQARAALQSLRHQG